MKKLMELKKEDLQRIFLNSEDLQELAREVIQENNMHYIGEKINILKPALSDYSIGFYNRNFHKVRDDINVIIDVIDDYINNFSTSEEILKKVENEKYDIELLEKLITQEIYNSIKYIENNLYDVNYLFEDFYEFIVDNLENYFYNDNKIIKILEVK